MMYHHDARDYNEAASAAAKKMRERLHDNIDKAQKKSVLALARIENEIPTDSIVRANALHFDAVGSVLEAQYGGQNAPVKTDTIHKWALAQICESVGLPAKYLQALMTKMGKDDPWGPKLAAHNLEVLFKHKQDRHLVRSYGNEMRGFLSPRYQRRHPGRILDVLIQGFKKYGLIAYDAWCSDTKHGVRAVMDRIIEPVPNECLGIGVYYSESPYGNGATELNIFIERMWCTNLAVVEQSLRSVHLGGQLQEDVAWSEETYKRDTELLSSKLMDLLEAHVSDQAIEKVQAGVRAAHEQKIASTAFEAFLKKHCSAEETREVVEVYRSADVEMLPPGNTAWRASNAISFFGGRVEDSERQFELQKLAGKALTDIKGEKK